jgi:hypothetical protein
MIPKLTPKILKINLIELECVESISGKIPPIHVNIIPEKKSDEGRLPIANNNVDITEPTEADPTIWVLKFAIFPNSLLYKTLTNLSTIPVN